MDLLEKLQIFEFAQAINMENFFTASNPFLICGRVLGFFPMAFDGPPYKGTLKLSWIGVLAFNFSLIFSVYLMISNLREAAFFYTSSSQITLTAYMITKNAELLIYFNITLYHMYNRKNIVRFLKLVHEVDEMVRTNTNENN